MMHIWCSKWDDIHVVIANYSMRYQCFQRVAQSLGINNFVPPFNFTFPLNDSDRCKCLYVRTYYVDEQGQIDTKSKAMRVQCVGSIYLESQALGCVNHGRPVTLPRAHLTANFVSTCQGLVPDLISEREMDKSTQASSSFDEDDELDIAYMPLLSLSGPFQSISRLINSIQFLNRIGIID